jgi:hypothetical protein
VRTCSSRVSSATSAAGAPGAPAAGAGGARGVTPGEFAASREAAACGRPSAAQNHARTRWRRAHRRASARAFATRCCGTSGQQHVSPRVAANLPPSACSCTVSPPSARTRCCMSSREHARGRRGVDGGRGPHHLLSVMRKGHHRRCLLAARALSTLLLPPCSGARSPWRARYLLVSLRPRLSGLLTACGRRQATVPRAQNTSVERQRAWRAGGAALGGDVRACMQAVRLASQRGATWRTGTTRR